jgi:hypothetical protein
MTTSAVTKTATKSRKISAAPAPTKRTNRRQSAALPSHVAIPDLQVRPGVPTDHLPWIGQKIIDLRSGQPTKVTILGDAFDLPSLNPFYKGKKGAGYTYATDIASGCAARALLDDLLDAEVARLDAEGSSWDLTKFALNGNHEAFITKYLASHPESEGTYSLDDFGYKASGWEQVPFLEIKWLDGVGYAHYFYPSAAGPDKPYSGKAEEMLEKIGHSFVQGHQQANKSAELWPGGQRRRGLVGGSCYLHAEPWKGAQGNTHYRGIYVLNNVENGGFDIMEITLDSLCREYEGVPLIKYMQNKYRKQNWDHLGSR